MTGPSFPPVNRAHAIVLVHGAWVGEWSWAPVIPFLERSGRMVRAVSLRGHGMRSSESGPHITLADHVDDVVALVETLDLERITLVGHSYGGRVISRAWSRIADRVAQMVYLDAHAPIGAVTVDQVAGRRASHDGMVPFARFVPDPAEFGGDESVDWFLSRVRPQSAATLDPSFDVELPATLDTTYVAATGDADSPFAGYAEAARASSDWRYLEVDASHWLIITRPEEVASIIVDPSRRAEQNRDSASTGEQP